MPLQVYYHSYFNFWKFNIHKLSVSGTARISSTKIHLFVIAPVFPYVSEELFPNPVWARFKTTSLIKHEQLSD